MNKVRLALRTLRAAGFPSISASVQTYATPRNFSVVDARGTERPFVSVAGDYKPMVEYATADDFYAAATAEATKAAEALANVGFTPATPITIQPNINNKLFISKPINGFYI